MSTRSLKKIRFNDAPQTLEALSLNWQKGFPLWELFEGRLQDENLEVQLECALKLIYLYDSQLRWDSSNGQTEELKKNLKCAINAFLLILPEKFDGIRFITKLDEEQYEVLFTRDKRQNPVIYTVKYLDLYFKKN